MVSEVLGNHLGQDDKRAEGLHELINRLEDELLETRKERDVYREKCFEITGLSFNPDGTASQKPITQVSIGGFERFGSARSRVRKTLKERKVKSAVLEVADKEPIK